MSLSYSKTVKNACLPKGRRYGWLTVILLPIWVFLSYFVAAIVTDCVVQLLTKLSFMDQLNSNVNSTILSVIIYLLTLLFAIGIPWLLRKAKTTKSDLGFARLMSWMDIVLSPAGLVVYIILSVGLTLLAKNIIPGFNIDQTQNTGFTQLGANYEYVLAFFTLVVVAPLAEEALFRGYLYGKLRKHLPIWTAILATSLTFAIMHFAWNVGVDVFALSIVLCLLREMTGSIWSSVLLHMLKNSIAFYFLYISHLFR